MTSIVENWANRPWRPSRERKPRRDSKLHGLAKEQRALVDKWLFDKGLTYQEVSEGCWQMFGLKVSKSSVGRYHERAARGKVKRVSGRAGKCASGTADEEVGGWAKEMCIGMLTGRGTPGTGEAYQQTLARMTKWALEEMRWPVADEQDVKTVIRFMRILISARMERNEAMMVELQRKKFEMRAARACVKYYRAEEEKIQPKAQSPKPKVGREPTRGEKDPMMVWDFPDGEIRRLPLLRQQAGPAPNIPKGNDFYRS
jgi:hypothetical protein